LYLEQTEEDAHIIEILTTCVNPWEMWVNSNMSFGHIEENHMSIAFRPLCLKIGFKHVKSNFVQIHVPLFVIKLIKS
jgi:hypothetical protein